MQSQNTPVSSENDFQAAMTFIEQDKSPLCDDRADVVTLQKKMVESIKLEKYPYVKKVLETHCAVLLTDHGSESFDTMRTNVREKLKNVSSGGKFFHAISLAFLLLSLSIKNKNSVVVTFGNSAASYLFMVMQYILSIIRKPHVHVLFDCLWERRSGFWGRCCTAGRSFLVNRTVCKCIVYGVADLEEFSNKLAIPRSKQSFVHYHHTLNDFKGSVTGGDYIFCGGNAGRVYHPLFRICAELRLPLKVASTDREAHELAKVTAVAEVKATTADEYLNLMARSKFVVLPFGNGGTRTVGHQTIINAMLMGKAVIVYNSKMSVGYIRDGENGIAIEFGNEERLRAEILRIDSQAEFRSLLGQNAQSWVLSNNLCRQEWALKVYDIALAEFFERTA